MWIIVYLLTKNIHKAKNLLYQDGGKTEGRRRRNVRRGGGKGGNNTMDYGLDKQYADKKTHRSAEWLVFNHVFGRASFGQSAIASSQCTRCRSAAIQCLCKVYDDQSFGKASFLRHLCIYIVAYIVCMVAYAL